MIKPDSLLDDLGREAEAAIAVGLALIGPNGPTAALSDENWPIAW